MTEKRFRLSFFFVLKYFKFLFENHPSLSQQPPSKNWDLLKASFWKFGGRLNPPPQQEGGALRTSSLIQEINQFHIYQSFMFLKLKIELNTLKQKPFSLTLKLDSKKAHPQQTLRGRMRAKWIYDSFR